MAAPDYDLAIVGSGILGCSHALSAIKRGLRVLLLERDSVPQQASVRNFGLLIPSALVEPWRSLGIRSNRIYRDLAAQAGLPIDQCGTLYVGSNAADAERLESAERSLREVDWPVEILSQGEVLDRNPLLKPEFVHSGLMASHELRVEPRELLQGLVGFLNASDRVDCRLATTVSRVETRESYCELRTSDGEQFRSGAAVICSGSDLRSLFPDRLQSAGMQYCKLQMTRSRPVHQSRNLPSVASPLCLRTYPAFEMAGRNAEPLESRFRQAGVHVWLAFDRQGRIVVGDSHEYSETPPDDTLQDDIEELFLNYAGEMLVGGRPPVESRWCGVYMQSPDGGVTTIRITDRVRVVTGLGGKGMTVSPALAEDHVVELIDEGVLEARSPADRS